MRFLFSRSIAAMLTTETSIEGMDEGKVIGMVGMIYLL